GGVLRPLAAGAPPPAPARTLFGSADRCPLRFAVCDWESATPLDYRGADGQRCQNWRAVVPGGTGFLRSRSFVAQPGVLRRDGLGCNRLLAAKSPRPAAGLFFQHGRAIVLGVLSWLIRFAGRAPLD